MVAILWIGSNNIGQTLKQELIGPKVGFRFLASELLVSSPGAPEDVAMSPPAWASGFVGNQTPREDFNM